jgi:hypothetical protein
MKKSSLVSARQIIRQIPTKASVVRQPKKVYCEMIGMGAKSSKNKESNCHSNKCNIWSLAPKGARHTGRMTIGRTTTSTSVGGN